ncbi:capsid protein, partial [Herbiconiux daphne]
KLDLTDALYNKLSGINLPYPLKQNINDETDSIALYTLAGGTTLVEFYDGTKDKRLNYEIRGKAQDPQHIEEAVYLISESLEKLQDIYDLQSSNNSFEFGGIILQNEPYFSDAQEDGFFYFSLTFGVNVTIFP